MVEVCPEQLIGELPTGLFVVAVVVQLRVPESELGPCPNTNPE